MNRRSVMLASVAETTKKRTEMEQPNVKWNSDPLGA